MSNFKNNIGEILADKAILPVTINRHSNPNNMLNLFEQEKDATLRHLKLTHIKDSDTCFTFDVVGTGADKNKFKTFSPYLKSSKRHNFNKRCDFIIVRKQDDIWQVYFGDLKSTRVEPGNILKQLKASQLFFNYILNIIKSEFGNEELSNYEARFICIHDNAKKSSPFIPKGPTIPGNAEASTKTIDGEKLTIMPVDVLSGGQARVSFNKIS